MDDSQLNEMNSSADEPFMDGVFECEKTIKLMNCKGFYVRMFSNSGQKQFCRVSTFPTKGWWCTFKTQADSFSLYNKKGDEKCVILFPRERYLANKNIEVSNQGNLFDVIWTGDMECRVTYMKKSSNVWLYVIIAIIVFFFLLII